VNARRHQKLRVFGQFTRDLASLSTCKRRSVGCLVAPLDFTSVSSIGYNGAPRGLPNDSCTGQSGDCGCVHAESNAIAKLWSREPSLMILTLSPCKLCAGLILNAGVIHEVYVMQLWRDTGPLDLLKAGGIRVEELVEL
jgi:dCMP deaminase